MKNLINGLYKVFIYCMLFLWGIITFTTAFDMHEHKIPFIIVIGGSIVLICILCNIYNWVKKLPKNTINKLAFCLFAIVFTSMLLWGINYQVVPSYDLTHIIGKTDSLLLTGVFGSDPYFSLYPTQIPLTIFIYLLKSVGVFLGYANPSEFVILYNAFMTSLMLYILYKIVCRFSGSCNGFMVMLLAAIYPDFYLYVSYYYTDIISMPFAIFGFYFLIKAEGSTSIKEKSYLLLSGILFGIGFKLRVVTLILLIAYIVSLIGEYNLKLFIKRVFFVLFGIIISIGLYSRVLFPMFDITIDETLKLPATHWVMMGLNYKESGGYSTRDLMFSLKSQNKKEDIKEVIKTRIKKVDPLFYYRKLRKVWSEGDHDIERKYNHISRVDWTHQLFKGKLNGILRCYVQSLKCIIYFFFLITILKERKNRFETSKNKVFIIAIFGAILFYLIWEALSRYSFSFLPIVLLGSSTGLSTVFHVVNKREISFKKKTISLRKMRKLAGYTMILGAFLISVLGYYVFVQYKEPTDVIRNIQGYSTGATIPVIASEIKEVFRVTDGFNRIRLTVNLANLHKKTDYKYFLYDENHELIYEGKYTFEPRKKQEKTIRRATLVFPYIEVQGKKEFTLKIKSEKATNRNFVAFNTFKFFTKVESLPNFDPEYLGNKFDMNPNAETYVDDILYDGSLYIKVIDRQKRSMLSKENYLVLAILIVLIISFNSYVLLIRERRNKV